MANEAKTPPMHEGIKAGEPYPRWGYRLGEDGELESKVFQLENAAEKLPHGWTDSPATATRKPRRGRPPKVRPEEPEAEEEPEEEPEPEPEGA